MGETDAESLLGQASFSNKFIHVVTYCIVKVGPMSVYITSIDFFILPYYI